MYGSRRIQAPKAASRKRSKSARPYKSFPKKFASARVPYDQTVIEHPSVGLGFSARTRLRTFFHAPVVKSATGGWTGSINPFSCYDPMGTLGLNQPNLFDQWKLIFDRYMVISATVKITISTQGVVAANVLNDSNELIVYPANAATATADMIDAASQPYAKTAIFQTMGDPKSIKFYLNHKKLLGLYGELEPALHGSVISASPAEMVRLLMMVQSSITSGVTNNCHLSIELIQDVWFDDRNVKVDVEE